ncbi:MAG: hypothetical protein DLM60_07625 [Pseudonocardiales bacterium]|nr:MAG: hypothetical protein DLM60_07625 [Pseudonocardiales bacterium]
MVSQAGAKPGHRRVTRARRGQTVAVAIPTASMSERVWLMSSVESRGSTKTPESSRYLSVDPETIGKLRILRVGDVELQVDGHRLVVRGTPVHLPHKEFVILRQLMNNAGRVVTRRNLLDNAWGSDRAGAQNCLGVHIRRLRMKIESDADKPTRIRNLGKDCRAVRMCRNRQPFARSCRLRQLRSGSTHLFVGQKWRSRHPAGRHPARAGGEVGVDQLSSVCRTCRGGVNVYRSRTLGGSAMPGPPAVIQVVMSLIAFG